jgi:ribosome-binding protein aMBF1 (putative translation factor)
MRIKEFNERVEEYRETIRNMGYDLTAQLEFEIARLLASKEKYLRDYDIRQIINEIMDSIDSSLSLGENLKIAENVIRKYDGQDYIVDNDYLEWLDKAQEDAYLEFIKEQKEAKKVRPRQAKLYVFQGKVYFA